MADWGGTKTNWTPDDGVNDKQLNRIERNIQYNYDRTAEIGRKKAGSILFHANDSEKTIRKSGNGYSSWQKMKETRVAAAGSFRVRFSMELGGILSGNGAKAYGRIYLNDSPVGTLRVSTTLDKCTYTENIDGVSIGDYIQIYGRIYVKVSGETRSAKFSNLRLYCENFDGAASIR